MSLLFRKLVDIARTNSIFQTRKLSSTPKSVAYSPQHHTAGLAPEIVYQEASNEVLAAWAVKVIPSKRSFLRCNRPINVLSCQRRVEDASINSALKALELSRQLATHFSEAEISGLNSRSRPRVHWPSFNLCSGYPLPAINNHHSIPLPQTCSPIKPSLQRHLLQTALPP